MAVFKNRKIKKGDVVAAIPITSLFCFFLLGCFLKN